MTHAMQHNKTLPFTLSVKGSNVQTRVKINKTVPFTLSVKGFHVQKRVLELYKRWR